jgi:dipeptidyl-peptidase-4
MKIIGLLSCFFIFFASSAQKKELSLNESVLQQYRNLSPDKMMGFSFVPKSTKYSYFEKYTTLIICEINSKTVHKSIDIKDVNSTLNSKLNYFSGFSWVDSERFRINDGNKFYIYNIFTKEGELEFDLEDDVENVTFNVSNQSYAYTKSNNIFCFVNGNEVAITNFSDKNIVSGQHIARNEFGISKGIFWSPKENAIAFYQKDESDVNDYPLLDIESVPGDLVSIKYPMAGLGSEKPKIGIYNIENKSTVYISPKRRVDDYLTNITWTPDGKFIVVVEVNREQNHMWLNVYDASTGMFIRSLFDEKNEKWVEPENPVFFPSNNSNNFIWISQRDGFNNLYYYNWSDHLIAKLTSNKFVTKSIIGTIQGGKEVLFTATGDSPLDFKYFAVNLKGKQREITKNSGTHSLVVGDDGKYFFDEYSSHSIPSKSLLLDASGKEIKVLLEGKNKLEEYAIGKTEIGTIKAEDGTLLYTRLIKPSNFDPTKKYPVMVYVYGGPHAQMIQNEWLDGANLWMHWMAEKGYLVFTLDNRGSANRGFEFESVIHRQLGTLEMEDQLAGVKYLKSLNYVDSNRFAVHGWSFGGFMTTSLMLRKPGVFNTGVAGGPVTDWKFYEVMYGERYMDLPIENPEGYKTASLLNYTHNLKGNLLLIHGTMDDVVVMQHNYSLIKKFVENGMQVDFFPYPMHKHNVTGKDRAHLIQKVLTYILENNI